MTKKPFHLSPDSFGAAQFGPNANVSVFKVTDAPPPRPGTPPAITRVLEGDGANLIFMTFTPGQILRSHTAAHPITVQAMSGNLVLETPDGIIELDHTTVVHLRSMVVHQVSAPEDAPEHNVLLLTMLTGEQHGQHP